MCNVLTSVTVKALPQLLTSDKRGQLLKRKKRPLQGRTFRVFNRIANQFNWGLIVDVGSNYGEMIFYSSMNRKQRIIAIEPNTEIFDCLKINLAEFRNVTILNAAAGTFNGSAFLETKKGHSGRAYVTHSPTALKIAVLDLAEVISQEQLSPVLVKIDIEGGEADVVLHTTHSAGQEIVWLTESHSFDHQNFKNLFEKYRVYDIDSSRYRIMEVNNMNLDRYISESSCRGNNCLLVPFKSSLVWPSIKNLRDPIWFQLERIASWLHRNGFREVLVGKKLNKNNQAIEI
jgi:FkbM family methyltransferase